MFLEVWTIYKEVATYYAAGLTPPDDVTLMFTDDNWGNVQRLPNEEERKRSGGIGVRTPCLFKVLMTNFHAQMYYHFAYVGRPKSYKWQNCNNLVSLVNYEGLSAHRLTRILASAQSLQGVIPGGRGRRNSNLGHERRGHQTPRAAPQSRHGPSVELDSIRP